MRILIALSLILMLGSAAIAQAPQQQTPSQIAIQLSNVIGQWAQAIEALQQQNTKLQADLSVVTKERDELKAKAEHK